MIPALGRVPKLQEAPRSNRGWARLIFGVIVSWWMFWRCVADRANSSIMPLFLNFKLTDLVACPGRLRTVHARKRNRSNVKHNISSQLVCAKPKASKTSPVPPPWQARPCSRRFCLFQEKEEMCRLQRALRLRLRIMQKVLS